MNKQYELLDPVKTESLPNSIQVAFYDLSKPIAGDRWFVRICCVATLPVSEVFFEYLDEDKEILNAMKISCEDGLTMEIVKERNFVDEQIKDDVVKMFIDQITVNSLGYMGSKIFPQKLFLSKLEEFKKQYVVQKEMLINEPLDEDDGPADFSACFRD